MMAEVRYSPADQNGSSIHYHYIEKTNKLSITDIHITQPFFMGTVCWSISHVEINCGAGRKENRIKRSLDGTDSLGYS